MVDRKLEKKEMKILVTGGLGFIGSSIAKRLSKSGHRILCVDRIDPNSTDNLISLRYASLMQDNIEFSKADLSNLVECKQVFSGFSPEIVIHLAARAGVRFKISDISSYERDNLCAFTNVIQESIENSVSLFLYASSSSVYGKSTEFLESNFNLHQQGIYASTKYSNEVIAHALRDFVISVGLRFFTVYGPLGRRDMACWKVLESLHHNVPFRLFGSVENARDFTYIDDVAEVLDRLVMHFSRGYLLPKILNVGKGKSDMLIDLFNQAQEITQRELDIVFDSPRNEDVIYTQADTRLLQETISYVPSTTLTQGLNEFNRWYVNDFLKSD